MEAIIKCGDVAQVSITTSPSAKPFVLHRDKLVLEESQGTLNDNVLEDGSRWDVDGGTLCCDDDDGTLESNSATKVDGTGDGKMIQLEDLWDRRDALLEVGNLLEVGTELDEWRWAETSWVNL